eukprot:UN02948
MHPYLGKLFGMPSNIMHGTWIFSKTMCSFEDRITKKAHKGTFKFIKPLIVPSKSAKLKVYQAKDTPHRKDITDR